MDSDFLTGEDHRSRLIDAMKRRADRAVAIAYAAGEPRKAKMLQHAAVMLFEEDNPYWFAAIELMKRLPVTIDEFVESGEFFRDQMEEIWPGLRGDLRLMNPDILVGDKAMHVYLDGGATGTGKTAKAHITQAYQLYWLTCFRQAHKLFGLSHATPIVFMMQSVSKTITNSNLYDPFKLMFTSMPYTKKWVAWDRRKENELRIEGNIRIVPAIPTIETIVGQAIPSAILDEVNFMEVIENSKRGVGPNGKGGRYDQAEELYNTITRRRKSRFKGRGPIPGVISVMSSVRYEDDFLDRKIAQVKASEDMQEEILWFKRKQYEVQPTDRYSGKTFKLLIGTKQYNTRVLLDDEVEGRDYPLGAHIEDVPVENRLDFLEDPENALRDVIGIATSVIKPYITQRHKVAEAIVRGTPRLKSWVEKDVVNLATDGLPQFVEANLPNDRNAPRFVHIDLAKNKDRCGVALCKVAGFENVTDAQGMIETVPHIILEMVVGITPSATKEIDIADVRNWVLLLKNFYGFNINTITYDGYASAESIQFLRKLGIHSFTTSMDITTEPYDYLRRCFYQDRIDMVDCELAYQEIINLEFNENKGKVDHSPKFSKDLSDAVAGCVYNAGQSRMNRSAQGVIGHAEVDGQTVRVAGLNRRNITRR